MLSCDRLPSGQNGLGYHSARQEVDEVNFELFVLAVCLVYSEADDDVTQTSLRAYRFFCKRPTAAYNSASMHNFVWAQANNC